jgi:hypothetical protein
VLSGITFSLFTPNRIGEYGGRILYVDARHAWHAVIASITGSFAQNLVHITAGLAAAVLLIGTVIELPETTGTGLWVFSICVICMIWFCYFYLPEIARILSSWTPPRILRRPWKALDHLVHTSRRQLTFALCFALIRYTVFSLQYILLLQFFQVDIPLYWLVGGVALIYFMQTSMPLPPFVDLIARNELGILLWAGFGVSAFSITAAGLTLWILNLGIPALFGLLAIAAVNVLRSLGYEYETLSPSPAEHAGHVVDRTSK